MNKGGLVFSLGDGSFDPYGTNFDLSHMTTILVSNKSPMDVDRKGSHGEEGIIKVEDDDIEAKYMTQPSTTPFNDVAQVRINQSTM